VGSVGLGSIYTFENDTGPDDANHSMQGIFMLREPGSRSQRLDGLSLFDIAPTILARFGLDPLPEMQGKVIAAD
jgi:predicted AlkP superfamily phosphohydrolase/phosphomutase